MSKNIYGFSLCSVEGITPTGFNMTTIKKTALAGLLSLAAFGAAASHAHAAPITVTNGALTIFNATTGGDMSLQNGTASNPIATSANQVYSGTYTGAINFQDPLNGVNYTTIGGFLSTSGGTVANSSSPGLQATVSTSNFQVTSLFDFQFTTGSDTNYTVSHDDGFSIWDSTNKKEIVSGLEGPTGEIPNTISLSANTTYNLWYAEANGLPADLIVSNVPEPTSMAVLGAGLISMGVAGRRRKRVAIAS